MIEYGSCTLITNYTYIDGVYDEKKKEICKENYYKGLRSKNNCPYNWKKS